MALKEVKSNYCALLTAAEETFFHVFTKMGCSKFTHVLRLALKIKCTWAKIFLGKNLSCSAVTVIFSEKFETHSPLRKGNILLV